MDSRMDKKPMTTPAMTTEQAFAALTQLVTYSNKLAQHTL